MSADHRWPILAVTVAFICAFPIINARSPLHEKYWMAEPSTTLGRNERRLQRQALRLLKVVYPVLGAYPHVLFMQKHWEKHSVEYLLIFESASGRYRIPLTRESGYSDYYGQERRWCLLCFFRYSVNPEEMLNSLIPLAEFWASRNGISQANGDLLLYSRAPITPLHEWQAGVLRQNRERNWMLGAKISNVKGAPTP